MTKEKVTYMNIYFLMESLICPVPKTPDPEVLQPSRKFTDFQVTVYITFLDSGLFNEASRTFIP